MKTMPPTDLEFFDSAPMRIVATASFSATPDRVFASFANVHDWPRWFPMMKTAKWISLAEAQLGAEREVALGVLGTFRERMIAWEPGKRFAFTMVASTSPLALQLAEDYRLMPEGSGTRLDWVMAARPTTIGKLAGPLTRAMMQKIFKTGGERLERLLSAN